MKLQAPDYYQDFRCACGQCPDTCCASWQVILDPATLQAYRQAEGDFGRRLRAALITEDGETRFRTQDGVCPMLSPQGLCQVQLTLGEQALCRVCRQYPRWVQNYGGLEVAGLSLSCPEVARMLLTRTGCVTFSLTSDTREVTQYHDLDPQLFLTLQAARKTALSLAQDRTHSLDLRAQALLAFARELQTAVTWHQWEKAAALRPGDFLPPGPVPPLGPVRASRRRKVLEKTARFLLSLEILTPQWRDLLRRFAAACSGSERSFGRSSFAGSPDFPGFTSSSGPANRSECSGSASSSGLASGCGPATANSGSFPAPTSQEGASPTGAASCILGPESPTDQNFTAPLFGPEAGYEQILVYFLDKYLLTACHDRDILAKINLAVASVFFLRHLAAFLAWESGRPLALADLVDLVHRYCRELEHSEPNMQALARVLGKRRTIGSRAIPALLSRPGF